MPSRLQLPSSLSVSKAKNCFLHAKWSAEWSQMGKGAWRNYGRLCCDQVSSISFSSFQRRKGCMEGVGLKVLLSAPCALRDELVIRFRQKGKMNLCSISLSDTSIYQRGRIKLQRKSLFSSSTALIKNTCPCDSDCQGRRPSVLSSKTGKTTAQS